MPPTTRTKPSSLAAEMAKKTKEMILDMHVKRMILERQQNNGRLPDGKMEDVLESLNAQGLESVTRYTVYNHEERLRLKLSRDTSSVPGSIFVDNNLRATASEASTITEVTDASTLDGREINKGGRPKGSTV